MTNFLLIGDQDPIKPLDEYQADPYSRMTSQQQRFAELATQAMVDVLGIKEEDIATIIDPDHSELGRFVLIDRSPNGQYHGNFNQLTEKMKEDPNLLRVEVDGELINTIQQTTYPVYWSMICEAQHKGLIHPDSVALSHTNDLPWTATMLTGEPLTDEGKVLVASVSGGAVSNVAFKTSRGGQSMRVRPAIAIPHDAENTLSN